MKNYPFHWSPLLCISLALLASCGSSLPPDTGTGDSAYVTNPASLVNPFHGTAPLLDEELIGYTPPRDWRVWAGLTYPGSSLPNAMVQLSPITEYGSGAGYEYEDTEIIGFTHTNKGHWNLCNLPVLPVSRKAGPPYKSSFDKATESAAAGFYGVTLEDYGVDVRLTSTLRTGFHAYTFRDSTDRRLLFDLGRANNRVRDWQITQADDNTVEGVQDMGRDRIYFSAHVNTPITGLDRERPGERDGYAMVDLGAGEAGVNLRVGISFVSIENARKNLRLESDGKRFADIRGEATDTWNELLGRVAVAGGSQLEQELFYTCLYRAFQWPALRSDANGEFTDTQGETRSEGFRYYTKPSLWDTYRNKVVLLSALRPEVSKDVIRSLIVRGERDNFMPTFFHGDHAAVYIANAHAQGIEGFDFDRAYELLLNNAYKEGGTRPHIKDYIALGYVPELEVDNPVVETVTTAGVSKTLEYAQDDYALAQLAKAAGDDGKYTELMGRSENYRNVFDPATKFMRGKLAGGEWVSPFNPSYPYYEYMYREGNGWQLSFYAPHAMAGLVQLYGGRAAFEAKLDSLFTVPWNPQHIARNISGFMGQYCHGNQPDHEAPYAYYAIGKPEKSQAVIDRLLADYYAVGDEGLAFSGMDDAGEMSSWYVCAAAGLYPVSPADNEYVVSLPVFDRVRWSTPVGKSLVVTKKGSSRALTGVEYNGRKLDGFMLPHASLAAGGELVLLTGEE